MVEFGACQSVETKRCRISHCVADRDEHVAVAAVVVEADLGEHGEIAGDPARCGVISVNRMFVTLWRTMRRTPESWAAALGDATAPPRNSTMAVAAVYRHTAAKLELAVLAEGFGELRQSHRVA